MLFGGVFGLRLRHPCPYGLGGWRLGLTHFFEDSLNAIVFVGSLEFLDDLRRGSRLHRLQILDNVSSGSVMKTLFACLAGIVVVERQAVLKSLVASEALGFLLLGGQLAAIRIQACAAV